MANRTANARTRLPRRRLIFFCVLLLAIVTAAYIHSLLRWKYRRLRERTALVAIDALGKSSPAEHAPVRALLDRFADLSRYSAANRNLPSDPGRVVFYGDSITELWPLIAPSEFFPAPHSLDRGIYGQATPELLWRFRQDVLGLHPSTVVLLAGANDVLLADSHLAQAKTEGNLLAMLDLANAQHIRVVVCSLLPITSRDPHQQPELTAKITALNAWLQQTARDRHLAYVDYYTALATGDGAFRAAYTLDGIHPNATGYHQMHDLAQQALDTLP